MKLNCHDASTVQITMLRDPDGDIEVRANGVELLWIMDDGTIALSSLNGPALRQLGFKIDDNDQVVIE